MGRDPFRLPSLPREIPQSWSRLQPSGVPGPLMVIGRTDTGKSTLSRYLVDRLRKEGHRAGFLDADPGQGSLGPPTTLSLRLVESGRTIRWFVGATSPSGHLLEQVVGVSRLTSFCADAGAAFTVIDTCGLLDERAGGHALKRAEFDLLQPAAVFALARERELDSLLAGFEVAGTTVVRLSVEPGARRRSPEERARGRQRSFRMYFQGAGELSLVREDWPSLLTAPHLRRGGLVGLLVESGFLLGLGLILDESGGRILLRSPLDGIDHVHRIVPGDVLVDPGDFHDRAARIP